jgi:hypothetical protein
MNDPQKMKIESETLGSTPITDGSASNTPVPDAEKVESAETSEPELSSTTTPYPEGSAGSKPNKIPVVLAKPAEPPAEPTPAPVKVSVAPRPAATKPASSPVADSSISIDGDRSQNVGATIVDAIAAAVAIAFTVLLAQEIIPFL